MLTFNNNHIFTGYLKQLLATVNLPTCKIYTKEFSNYLTQTGKEDPRIVESFGSLGAERPITNVNYLKGNRLGYLYYDLHTNKSHWVYYKDFCYDSSKKITGLTRQLKSLGPIYDTKTHEYLGDFLRFLRDYYNINLLSMYNCFNNKICSNIYFKQTTTPTLPEEDQNITVFNSADSNFNIYAFPVKLFSKYTIAIDCNQGIEMFCGFYNKTLELNGVPKYINLFQKTYQKINKTMFNQPFVYDKLSYENWTLERELTSMKNGKILINDSDSISRYDILNREQDLKLFLKIPATCKSTITVLEGDFSTYNDFIYTPNINNTRTGQVTRWDYKMNSSIINFYESPEADPNNEIKCYLNGTNFKPISKLQLLAFNTGKSYPFADRLIAYLSGSVITPIDEINDNIKRAQKVMAQNNHYFKIDGIWENKMQKIAYDYIINAGPIEYDIKDKKLIDKRNGRHSRLGYGTKSNLYDILGYIDKDIEKCYASWKSVDGKAVVKDNIQSVDIYDGLYDI